VAVHSVYQPNIASTNEKIRERSRRSFLEELSFTESVGADALVIHSGSYSADSSLTEGLKRSGESIRRALSEVPGHSKVVIENVAGGDRRIGGRFEELRSLLEEIGDPDRTGLCLDTAHTFGAGYPIDTDSGLEDTLAEWDKVLGFGRLELFHFNDSGAGLGSHRDIHEHLGRGLIGLESLRKLANDPRFAGKAGVIETPKMPPGSDAANLSLLRGV
jgi:deoxyribonuclease-4